MNKLWFIPTIFFLIGVLLNSSYGQPEYKGFLLIELNQYRYGQDLGGLVSTPKLDAVAQAKCNDMVERDYFSHENPEGKFVWEMIDLPYNVAGENLASGYTSAEQTVQAWAISPLHNDNLLNTHYSQVGHGVCWDKNEYKIVQVFKG